MRWLFRLAILSIVVMLALPGNEQERHMVMQGLSSAFFKTLNYCDERPDLCERGRAAFNRVKVTAAEGISDLANAAREQTGSHHSGFGPRPDTSRTTLGQDDYEPGWQLP